MAYQIDPDHFPDVYFNRVTFMRLCDTEAKGTETGFEEDGISLFCEDTSEGVRNAKIEVFIADEILDLIVARHKQRLKAARKRNKNATS